MYRRSCWRTAERIDASRRPRIDFLVVKLTTVACAQQAVHRYCLNLRPSGAKWPHIFGIPSDMSTDGMCRPSADRNKGNMTLTVWTGWTTSSAALQAAAAVADFSSVETNYRLKKKKA